MLVPAFVTHKFPDLSATIPTGEFNSLGKIKVLKEFVFILYSKIAPLIPYDNIDIHIEFLLLSNVIEPVVTRVGSIPSNNPLIGIVTLEIPSDVPFLIFDMSPIQSEEGENVPTKKI